MFNWILPDLFIGYLIGSIPFGLVLTRLAGYGDIRKIGSGNIGATNVLRTGNKFLAALTLLLDSGKGAAAVLICQVIYSVPHYYFPQENPLPMALVSLIAGLGAILGHCFPIWLKFKGGKGVSTTLGMLLVAVPWTGFVAICTWGIVAGFSFYSSLAALVAIGFAPIATLLLYGPVEAALILPIIAIVFWRHKDNIKRLIDGSEPKIGQKKKQDEPASTLH